tara:strand:+ start:3532 stop:4968 length:1437 start_codon:yes stop_codon:yes gene_type:complete
MANIASKHSRRGKRRQKEVKFKLVSNSLFLKDQLVFMDTKDDEFLNSSPLLSTPTFAFVDPSQSDSKVFISYEHSIAEDKEKIKAFFSKTNRGTQFTISNADWQYVIDTDYKTADVGGTYEFLSLEDDIIVAKAVSVTSLNAKYKTYKANYFIESPQISINVPTNTTKIAEIKNLLGSGSNKSFSKMGLDSSIEKNLYWIEIGGSNNNTGKLSVIGYRTDSEGAEILKIDGKINEESFLAEGRLNVNLFVKVKDLHKTKKSKSAAAEFELKNNERLSNDNTELNQEKTQQKPIQPLRSNTLEFNINTSLVNVRFPDTPKIKRTFNVTVSEVDGSNKFIINKKRQESIVVYRGRTYKFVQTDPSNAACCPTGIGDPHPLAISKTQDGSHNNDERPYIIGVSIRGSLGKTRTLTFRVPLNAPDKLYYYCQNHMDMGGTLLVRNDPSTTRATTPSSTTSTPIPTTTRSTTTTTRSSSMRVY